MVFTRYGALFFVTITESYRGKRRNLKFSLAFKSWQEYTRTMQTNYITFSETTKTFCRTTRRVGMAMIANGNPYAHNRGAIVTNLKKAISGLLAKGFSEVGNEKSGMILVTKSELEVDGVKVETKNRWHAKRKAAELAKQRGCSWFNLKKTGQIVEIK